ncbi:MAG: endonuclease/exonuclease/phosphatase family protein [Patescibacteria group bacterium]
MAAITDPLPSTIAAEVKALRTTLDVSIPPKRLDQNLLIGTWNLREFGGLTEKWKAAASDTPKRDLHALVCIAEILSRFDVVAVQEVTGKLKALRHMLKYLGPDWNFILTDVTRGAAGNDERLAFLFDTRRVSLSGLACELVLPRDALIKDGAGERQFVRTPYAVSFRSGSRTFILVTLHVIWGDNAAARAPELAAIAKWLANWASDMNAYDHNLICLGDFNIDRVGDPLYQAFTSTGLFTPPELNAVPRTIFYTPGKPETQKHYDQVAWFRDPASSVPVLAMSHVTAGTFDFVPHEMTGLGLTKQQLSFRISDHLPLWAEFLL